MQKTDPSRPNMSFYRLDKIQKKNFTYEITKRIAHNFRAQPTPNSDPSRRSQNKILLGPKYQDVRQQCETLIAQHQHPKGHALRKSAVVLVEHVMSVSRSYFLDEAGNTDLKRVDEWAQKSLAWICQEQGDNVVSVVLHVDEQTPHIHALTVPLLDGHLQATTLYGKRAQLHGLQDRYAAALKPLGIVRGIKRRHARHQDLKKFYAFVEHGLDTRQIDLSHAKLEELFSSRAKMAIASPAASAKELKRLKEMYKVTVVKAAAFDALNLEHNRLLQQRTSELSQAQDVNLHSLLSAAGQKKCESTPGSGDAHYETNVGDIVISKEVWVNTTTYDKGIGSVTLAQHLLGLPLQETLQWMVQHIGMDETIGAELIRHQHQVKTTLTHSPDAAYAYTPPSGHSLTAEEHVQHTFLRHIDAEIALPHLEGGTIYVDQSHLLVFLCTNEDGVTGAELAEATGTGCARDPASAPGGVFRTPTQIPKTAKQLFVCSDAVSALVMRQQHGIPAISLAERLDKRVPTYILNELVGLVREGVSLILMLTAQEAKKLKRAIMALLTGDDQKLPDNTTIIDDTEMADYETPDGRLCLLPALKRLDPHTQGAPSRSRATHRLSKLAPRSPRTADKPAVRRRASIKPAPF